jgi:predicted nucleic acid-binding protein
VLREPLLTTEYVLWEIVNAFSAREDRAKAHAAVEAIRSTPEWNLVAATPQMFDAGLALHRQRPDKDWSLTDCLSFTVMERHGIRQSLTPDHHFEQAGFDAVLRRDPP